MSDALDDGPFFHGSTAELQEGDLLTPGFNSNFRPEVVMNHICFTALTDGAGRQEGSRQPHPVLPQH